MTNEAPRQAKYLIVGGVLLLVVLVGGILLAVGMANGGDSESGGVDRPSLAVASSAA